jgi:transposase
MDHFAGLDVSVKETSVCIVDETGKIVREVKVASEPEALLSILKNSAYRFKRIGLEAGPLSQWLFSALAEAELPVVCVETRHMQAVLKAQINKTDRNDACQSALERAPRSASKRDPFVLRFRRLAVAPSELVGVAETARARVGV